MSECGYAMSVGSRLSMLWGVLKVLKSLPRLFVPRLVILFSLLLLGNAMGMRANVM